ncbi:DoxX family protein [Micromonospora coxensis]|uniref:DoxX-like family protein n=1 Tax=Micromonospora coxensis TaxID=356852 RepID=A0A1C5IHR6_9ACTN|nr:DoxX family protein [Micromonospora coxensis]SCG57942.1 DoxX-like family protein [Micromonospora coxensis]
MSRPTALPERHRAAAITAWVLQILLGFAIAGGGLLKLTGDPTMVEMFDDIGAGQWLRFVVGALEVAGGVGLLVPRLRALAALGLLLLLIGAAVVNVTVLHTGPLGALAFAAVALAVLLLRRHELRGKLGPATS